MHTEHPLHLPPISGRNSVDTRILVISSSSSSSPEATVAVVAAALAKAVHLGPKDTFIRDHLYRHPELQACKIHQKVASRMSSNRLADTDWR
jgi:hypothetical protein